jgi:hypothetical protein
MSLCKRCGQTREAPIHIGGMVSNSHAFVPESSGYNFPEPPNAEEIVACDFFKRHPHERYHFHGTGNKEYIHWNIKPEGPASEPLDREAYGYTAAHKLTPAPREPKPSRSLRERLGLALMALGRRVSRKG